MKKSHGPGLRAAVLEVARCTICRGKAVVSGVFHELPCWHCNASGWVAADTGEALPLEVLVTQLSFKLQAAERALQRRSAERTGSAPAARWEPDNRRGAGGSHYTGD